MIKVDKTVPGLVQQRGPTDQNFENYLQTKPWQGGGVPGGGQAHTGFGNWFQSMYPRVKTYSGSVILPKKTFIPGEESIESSGSAIKFRGGKKGGRKIYGLSPYPMEAQIDNMDIASVRTQGERMRDLIDYQLAQAERARLGFAANIGSDTSLNAPSGSRSELSNDVEMVNPDQPLPPQPTPVEIMENQETSNQINDLGLNMDLEGYRPMTTEGIITNQSMGSSPVDEEMTISGAGLGNSPTTSVVATTPPTRISRSGFRAPASVTSSSETNTEERPSIRTLLERQRRNVIRSRRQGPRNGDN
jgi:hypothetical protein